MKLKRILGIVIATSISLSVINCNTFAKKISREDAKKYSSDFDWSGIKSGITKDDEVIYAAKQIATNWSYEYFRNNYESNAKIIVDLLNKDTKFESNVDLYMGITEEFFKEEKDKTNYYYDVLIELILSDDFNNSNINTVENSYKSKIKKAMDNILSEKLNISVDDLKNAKTSVDMINKFDINSSEIKDIKGLDEFLIVCDTVETFTNEFSEILALNENIENKKLFLTKIKENSKKNKSLVSAIEKIIEKLEIAKNETINKYIDTFEEADKEAGKDLKAAFNEKATEIGLVATGYGAWSIAANGTAFAMNNLFGIDKLCEQYLKLAAISNIEEIFKKVANEDLEKFKQNSSVENAKVVISEADCYKALELYGANLSIEYADTILSNGIVNKVKYLFNTEGKEFKATAKKIKEMISNESFTDSEFKDLDTIIASMNKDDTIPAGWAEPYIKEAKEKCLFDIECGYTKPITRAEFCRIICFTIESKNYNISELIKNNNGRMIYSPFNDTRYEYVDKAYRLGIINGLENNTFNPLGYITREEAAVILKNTAEIFGYNITTEPCNDSTVSSWAKDSVEYTIANGIMEGDLYGNFAPKKNITKQEAIITMLNLYKNEGKKERINKFSIKQEVFDAKGKTAEYIINKYGIPNWDSGEDDPMWRQLWYDEGLSFDTEYGIDKIWVVSGNAEDVFDGFLKDSYDIYEFTKIVSGGNPIEFLVGDGRGDYSISEGQTYCYINYGNYILDLTYNNNIVRKTDFVRIMFYDY